MKHLRRCWKQKFLKKGYFSSGKNLLTFFARVSEHEKSQRSFYKGPEYLLTFFVQVIRSFLWDLGAKFKIISVRLNWLLKKRLAEKATFPVEIFLGLCFLVLPVTLLKRQIFKKEPFFPSKKFSALFSCNIE